MKEKDVELERLIRMDRFRSLSEMASGIGHEFNQPLFGIRAFAENILISYERGWDIGEDEIKYKMQRIIEQVDRMSELIDHISNFSHDELRHDILKVNVNKVLASAIQIVSAQFRYRNILLELNEEDNPLFIKANPFALEEIVLNLLYNARDAVQAFSAQTQKRLCSVVVAVKRTVSKIDSKHMAVIEVTDTGIGIPKDLIDRIFDPFFTTKGPDRGIGLGLTSAKSLTEEFGGTLDIISESGYGTTALLTFPIFAES